jgi:hypothetical protein
MSMSLFGPVGMMALTHGVALKFVSLKVRQIIVTVSKPN